MKSPFTPQKLEDLLGSLRGKEETLNDADAPDRYDAGPKRRHR